MTADQKRAHLTLLGMRAMFYTQAHRDGDPGFRIFSANPNDDKLLMFAENRWYRSYRAAIVAYANRQFSDIPDELLDRLELSLIEQFMALTSQEK